jgi:hypothetical protein
VPLSEGGAWRLQGALEALLGLPRVELAGGDGHPWRGDITVGGVRGASAEAEARRLAHWLRTRAEILPDSVQVGTHE